MNYIYDIYLNFNKIAYDFFDWNKNDKLIHIKKIPVFKVDENVVHNLISYNIKLEDEILNSVYNKTELYNSLSKIEFCALFCDNNNIVALQFDKNGYSIKKSFLYIEEELDILDTVYRFKEIKIDYKVLNKMPVHFKTRKELKDEYFINKELKTIENNKLNYIYFECFGKYLNNRKETIKKIKNISKDSKAYKNLYDILKLTSTTQKKML